jgi:hypothetical protein
VEHHAAAYLTGKGSANPMGRLYLLGWTPGRVAVDLPDNSGQLLPANKDVVLELRYTTVVYETTDQTQIGLYFWEEPPANVMRDEPIVNTMIRTPPYESNYHTQSSRVFDNDIMLYALTPHMHYRGKSMQYTAEYPDGTLEVRFGQQTYDEMVIGVTMFRVLD